MRTRNAHLLKEKKEGAGFGIITVEFKMIPIREHNDIVQKLMKEITNQEQEIKGLAKERGKTSSQVPQLQPTNNETVLNKKMGQLTKEHKERVSALTQQLRNKSVENKDLKERLTLKHNMEAKEKEHIAQILKKTYDRKPSSGADYKISALVSHYDAELDKKAKYIESLQKQMRQFERAANKESSFETMANQNYKALNLAEEKKGISFTEHQKEMNMVKVEMNKFKRFFEEKDKEYRDLARRYSELTNQYYKIVNSYGIEEQQTAKIKPLKTAKSNQNIEVPTKKVSSQSRPNALQNLLQEMVGSQSQAEEGRVSRKGFASKVANIGTESTYLQQQSQAEQESEQEEEPMQPGRYESSEQGLAVMKMQEIMQQLSLQDPQQIMPYLAKQNTNMQEYKLIDTIARSLLVFFYNIGKGKLTKKELVGALEDLEVAYNRNLEAVDLLDEACIEAGAKRQKLRGRIQELVGTSQEYYGKLKSIKFMQELAKGNKVVEFIEFFELEREEVALPQQLMRIQEQLKSIDKFVKECRVIMEIGDSSNHEVMQLVVRYLEKTTSLVSQLEKKKSKARQE